MSAKGPLPTPARDRAARGLKLRLPPTDRQIEVFLATLRWTTEAGAAKALGIRRDTISRLLSTLYARLGAVDRVSAAVKLWQQYPKLRSRMVLPGDRRKRSRDRRQ